MRKPDFGSMLLILLFAIVIIIVIYFAGIRTQHSFIDKNVNTVWYSKPTWFEPTSTPTPKPTEPTEETEEYVEDEESEEE